MSSAASTVHAYDDSSALMFALADSSHVHSPT